MHDINGETIAADDEMQLACKVIDILDDGILVRILNSEMELLISYQHDEVLGTIASAELTKVVDVTHVTHVTEVKPWPA